VTRHFVAFFFLVLGLAAAPSAQAQDRATLLQQATAAYDDFDPQRAIRLARAALNPALGSLDSTWTRGVHLLAQILIEEQQGALAGTWARWAMRSNPALEIDSVGYLAGVVDTLRAARAAAVRTAGDEVTRESYAWPTPAATTTEARLRLAPSAVPVSLLVRGIGLVGAGPGLVLPPGTHELEVSASGFLPVRLTREALPGVTTELAFTLVPSTAAATSLVAESRSLLSAATVPLTVTRFGAPPACVAGVAASGERLVVTSYHAIRGADAIAGNGDVRVAAWDVAANLAVLVLPTAAPAPLATAGVLVEGQALWGVTLADCRTASETRSVLQQWDGRPAGSLLLGEAPSGATTGTPLVDYQGRLAGVWSGGTRAAPATVVTDLVARATENVIAQRVLTPMQVATQENHRFGSVVVAVDVPNATVRFTPLETWQWAELAANGTAPFTFRGAAGRYTLVVSAPGIPARTQEIVVRAGETTRTSVSLRAVAQGPGAPAAAAPKKGVSKWVWIGLIGAAGGAAAMAGGGGGGGGGGGSTGGSVTVTVPVP
jgi:hypothetical protein